ncbi:hypothetical protein K503DRAFT_819072 [Rhizopogon vinicolor AM-OR11-026]|uniref:Uncharacterized protein n=1 Tax=Rhizopogon vinicolor AM-OR11-026 TaxID=1314800 RepID=A0A1B7MZL8_9AGAM|nr:hypothetical protein K503DRAFT_819072 [Rhizopogon vinicolor AM-OR11-026]
MSRGRTPGDLKNFCSMGTPCPTDVWVYKLWEKFWLEGDIGITSHPVVRDESPISLNPPIPPSCWVMNTCHSDEFALFRVSRVLVRESFVRLACIIIAFYGGDYAISTTGGFANPFMGFTTEERKVVIVSGTPGNDYMQIAHHPATGQRGILAILGARRS